MTRGWRRLADLLIARRVALGYTNRTKFFEDKGVKQSQQRLLIAIENCERTNFGRPTLALAEQVYEWQSGSIQTVLDGGDPTPYESGVRVRIDLPIPSATRREAHAFLDTLDDAQLARVLRVLRASVDDD